MRQFISLFILVEFVVVLLFSQIISLSEGLGNKSEKSDSGSVLVRVGPFSITESDYKAYMQFRKFELLNSSSSLSNSLESLKEKVLDEMVFQYLVLILALRENISFEDGEVEQVLEMGKEKLGGEDAYKRWLEQNNISEAELKDRISQKIIIDKYIQKVREDIKVPEEKVKEVYDDLKKKGVTQRVTDTYDFANIFLPDPTGNPEIEKEVMNIYLRIQKGEDFFSLAKEYSKDDVSTKQGYSYYEMSLKDVIPEIRHYLILLPVSSVSPPFRSRDGWNIIKVLGKYQKGTTIPYEKMKIGLEKQIIESELKKILKDRTEKLKNEIEIVYIRRNF